jgi:Fe-S oxidoreductase
MGVNPTPWGYSVYDEIADKLGARGIPHEQIAAIGDADSDAKKQAQFERVHNGSVRVLIGCTQKMGTGTNVQKRLVALHHLDAPWKSAEVEQREGRILRQGNENQEVAIYRYVTEGSFDAYMWRALETTARFIAHNGIHYVVPGLAPCLCCGRDQAGTPHNFEARHVTTFRLVPIHCLRLQ